MSWWCKEPEHQQLCYWPNLLWIFWFQRWVQNSRNEIQALFKQLNSKIQALPLIDFMVPVFNWDQILIISLIETLYRNLSFGGTRIFHGNLGPFSMLFMSLLRACSVLAQPISEPATYVTASLIGWARTEQARSKLKNDIENGPWSIT